VTRSFYGDDLTRVHDEGFGEVARGAAEVATRELEPIGAPPRRVVELGCGTGILARILVDAGHRVMGVDVSQAMIDVAAARVPEAEFRVLSFDEAELRALGFAVTRVSSYGAVPLPRGVTGFVARKR